ncbi:hypothetical protein DFH28DRAFT_891917 [Melampsora americana]|nr:hypothetical protein DFH28DRAFT_891917 [Melampsora americana]
MQLAQSSTVAKKNKPTKTKMPRQSKRKTTAPAKPRSPRTTKEKKSKSQTKKSKKCQSDSEASQDQDTKDKTTIHWDQDDNGEGKSSMYLLLNWLTDENNFTRFKDNKTEKRTVAEEIERYLIQNGIKWRDENAIARLETAWRKADQERNRTGAGSWKTAQEQKACSGWADDHPDWMNLEKAALVPILKCCKYYFELEPVFAPRHGNVRLASSHSLPPNAEDDDLEVLTQHDERGQEIPEQDSIDGGEPTMADIRNLMTNNNEELQEFEEANPPKTPIRESHRSQTHSQISHSSTSIKRTPSTAALDLSSQSTSSKRARSSGSASLIQSLFQERDSSSTPAPSDNFINLKEDEAMSKHSQKLDRLTSLAENVTTAIFGQQPDKPTLSDEQAKKKSEIEIEMAEVKLDSEKFDLDARKEKHLLETMHLQAELEHQKITRNANLISTLMKEHNLSIQDAMIMAQHAQMMSTSTSSASK